MNRRKKAGPPPSAERDHSPADQAADEQIDQLARAVSGSAGEAGQDDSAGVAAAAGADGALVEPAAEAVQRLSAEVEEVRDRYLRLAAEFDNFRKRMTRERAVTWVRAQAEVIANTLDALDDLARVAAIDPSQASVQDVLSGIELVERKLLRELEGAGLARVGQIGDRFDPNLHEAVGAVPASSHEEDGRVAVVLQVGYQFGDVLIRPARVHVSMAPDPDEGGDEPPASERS